MSARSRDAGNMIPQAGAKWGKWMGGKLNDLGLSGDYFKVFVETGTYLGHTTELAASIFSTVYTIELSEEIHLSTKEQPGGGGALLPTCTM